MRGESEDEVLVSGYADHPSMANDNLSGLALMALLARELAGRTARATRTASSSAPGRSGRSRGSPATRSGSTAIKHGLVCLCVGDPGPLTYKQSRRGDAEIDRAAQLVLRDSGEPSEVHDWEPWGGDERQFNSPGFNLPVGTLTRSAPGSFPEYHTSADDLDFVRPEALARSFQAYLDVFDVLETNAAYVNLSPKGEPQLGRRGPLPGDRRRPRRERGRALAALGAQPLGRRAHAGGRRRAVRAHVRAGARRRANAASSTTS